MNLTPTGPHGREQIGKKSHTLKKVAFSLLLPMFITKRVVIMSMKPSTQLHSLPWGKSSEIRAGLFWSNIYKILENLFIA